jgi:GNAT superfamily N-acetyltransferase
MNKLCERHGFGPIATVRPTAFGDLWFLAQLFVSPDQQGRGIGQELLQRTFQHAVSAKAGTKALITFAFNGVSQGLHMRQFRWC